MTPPTERGPDSPWKRISRFLRRHERGQALVEFALLTPVLLFIIAGIVEAGRLFLAYEQLANAAREGARQGSFTPKETSTISSAVKSEVPSWISSNIINVAVACSAADSDAFADCVTSYPPSSGDKIRVEAQYAYQPIMPVISGLATFTAVTMSTTAVMRVQ